ncbi:SdpI family protein [Gemmatimonas sp.]|uniref:SdpI family protein n=1 Tax=Gemmatimonas sp. TaxID=1962908 RepID=UPI0039C89FE9
MRRGELPPDRTVGLRTSATLRAPAVWYAAHAASGRDFAYFGVVLLAAAPVLPWLLGRTALPVLLVLVVSGSLLVGGLAVVRASLLGASHRQTPSTPSDQIGKQDDA